MLTMKWIIFRKSNWGMFVFCWHINFSRSLLPLVFFLSNQFFHSRLEESQNCILGVPSVGKVVTTRMSTNLSIKELSRQFLGSWAVNYWILLASDVQTGYLYSFFTKSGKLVLVLVRDEARHEDAEVESERQFASVLENTEEPTKCCPLWEAEKTIVAVVCPSLVHSIYAFTYSLLMFFFCPPYEMISALNIRT